MQLGEMQFGEMPHFFNTPHAFKKIGEMPHTQYISIWIKNFNYKKPNLTV